MRQLTARAFEYARTPFAGPAPCPRAGGSAQGCSTGGWARHSRPTWAAAPARGQATVARTTAPRSEGRRACTLGPRPGVASSVAAEVLVGLRQWVVSQVHTPGATW
jgi:hypothetical protein